MKENYYFYIWTKSDGKRCFGITGNPERRRHQYQDIAAENVSFDLLLKGTEREITVLERDVKNFLQSINPKALWRPLDSKQAFNNREWVNKDVEGLETIVMNSIGIKKINIVERQK